MTLDDWLRRHDRQRREPSGQRQQGVIPARATGVYSTLHTTAGDFDTGPPTFVEIDCELITYHLAAVIPFDCQLTSTTLHLGIHAVELSITPDKVRKGGHLTVSQAVSFRDVIARNKLPEWSR